jgi:lysophospholipase L1-like esterase
MSYLTSKLWLGCIVALALCLPARGESSKVAEHLDKGDQPVTIVCIGDSITGVYYHSGALRAYPEMLQIALRKACPKAQVTVRNAGISGDTSKGGLARLERDVLSHKPQLVTVMFGMNDLVGTPLEVFKKNMTEIISRCRKAGAEAVLCTQNSVVETPARPSARLLEFTQAIRDLGKVEGLNVADCHAAFEAVRSKDAAEWLLLLSDTIHPNMDGHKLFASTIAKTVTGKEVSLANEGPPQPALRHLREVLGAGKPAKILAMPPYDKLLEPALKQLYPEAKVEVTPWTVEGLSLAEIRKSAVKVRGMKVDMVMLAIPASAGAANPEEFHQHYSWTMNLSLSFGPQLWDVAVALPSAHRATLTADEQKHEAFARRLVKAQDLNIIAREAGDAASPQALLSKWLKSQLGKGSQ